MAFYKVTLLLLFERFLSFFEKSTNNMYFVFYHNCLEFEVKFSKSVENLKNFCFFVFVYIVKLNFKCEFLGSARRCKYEIDIMNAPR